MRRVGFRLVTVKEENGANKAGGGSRDGEKGRACETKHREGRGGRDPGGQVAAETAFRAADVFFRRAPPRTSSRRTASRRAASRPFQPAT